MVQLRDSYDVVIIGAGVGGGALVSKLAGSGLDILLIERGPRLERSSNNWSVDAVFKDRIYTAREQWLDKNGKAFNPSIFYFVGGNSKFFGAATFRFRAEDFEELQHEGGVSPAWPIRYAQLAPYYDEAERLMGTHGQAGVDPCEPPRQSPMPFGPIGHEPEIEALNQKLRERGLNPFPLPIAVDYHQGGSCIRCGTCDGFACKLGAKGDAEVRLIDPAIKSGNVTLITESFVERLLTDASGQRITQAIVNHQGSKRTVTADIFISSAGAINSSALLLRSANDKHKRGIGNTMSDQLGRNYMAHNNTAMMAVSPFKHNRVVFQKTLSVNDYYLGSREHPYPLGNVQGLGKLQGGMLTANARWAPEWATRMLTQRSVDWWIMSEDLPDPENRVTLTPSGQIKLSFTPNNLNAHRQLVKLWGSHMRALGYPIIIKNQMDVKVSMHQCGTARFGDRPETSVLDPYCKVWDVENLYVVDASFLPSSTALNPSLTIVAQALRTADHILRKLGKRLAVPIVQQNAKAPQKL